MRHALLALFVIAALHARAQTFGTIEATVTADPGQVQPTLKLRAEGKGGTFDSETTRLERVPPGTYSVYAFAHSPGYYFVRTAPQKVEVKANAVSRVSLRYRTVLRGTIKMTGARPQQLIIDPVRKSTRTHSRAGIGVNGAFDAAGLDPGEYLAKLTLSTHTLVWPVTVGDGVAQLNASFDLHAIEGGTIDAETGRVVDGADIEVRPLEAGAPVERFRVKSNVGRGGGIEISQLPSGRYTLAFSRDGYAPRTITIDVPRQAKLGEVALRPVPREVECPETTLAAAAAEELSAIAAAVRYLAASRNEWWKNPAPVAGFETTTELLLRDEAIAVPFDDLSLGRVKTLRRKPLWDAFRERATAARSLRGMEMPPRVRLACAGDEAATALIETYPKASLAISASLPGILGDEALVYIAAQDLEEGFVVYLERAQGVWKARWHVQVSPGTC